MKYEMPKIEFLLPQLQDVIAASLEEQNEGFGDTVDFEKEFLGQ